MTTFLRRLSFVAAVVVFTGLTNSSLSADSAAASPSVVSIQLPAETATYRQGPGQDLAQTLCITCHSADYAEMQPPMPKKFWEANVKKMREKFGAPIPENLSAQLAEYLTTAYGIPEKK